MRQITITDICDSLRAVGLDYGQTVFVYTDLRNIGALRGVRTRHDFCAAYLHAILDVIGPEGTLVVPTYTTQVARFDLDFIWEETPTPMGIFPEHVRTRPGSVRSIHPLLSLTAHGRHAARICADNGTSSHGVDSPYDRMREAGAKILSIGLGRIYAVGIAHHLEAACSLPYCYNKLLKWRPVVAGRRLERPYFATLRYAEFLDIPYALDRFADAVDAADGMRAVELGNSTVCMTDYRHCFDVGRVMLRDQPYMFLAREPDFVYGQIPFDGPTATRDRIATPDDAGRLSHMNWSGYYL